MKNKHVKRKKEVIRSYVWATICLGTLLCAALGIMYCMLGSDMQFSPVTGGLLWLVIVIILLTAIFVWKSWYRNAYKKCTEEYEKEIEMLKSNRAFTVYLLFLIILGIGFGFGWFFGHHRPTQEILNAEPTKIYPLYPNTTYVKYREVELLDGTVRRLISSSRGTRGTNLIIPPGGSIPVLPEGVTAIDIDNAGISPYEFLNLK